MGLLDKLRSLEAEKPREAPAAKRSTGYYHSTEHFPLTLFGDTALEEAFLTDLYRQPFPKGVCRENLLFLDTETTGLSGGAGTVAFEIGIGYFQEGEFRTEQFLMHDYPEEAAMLEALSGILKEFSVLVTFNGRSFDAPLLRSRLLMNRLPDCLPPCHADVLYPARRLWKLRLQKCNLGHLEEELLGVTREEDLPGALVPQTYFQYLKDGNFAPLRGILDHNRQDIVSLAQLFFYVNRFAAQPEKIREDKDLLSLAREMERQKKPEAARKCYRLLSRGNCRRECREEAFTALAQGEKRRGNPRGAVKLYTAMLRRGERAPEACEALAKLYEHQLHDLQQALAYTRRGLILLSEPSLQGEEDTQAARTRFLKRYQRLSRLCAARPNEEESS